MSASATTTTAPISVEARVRHNTRLVHWFLKRKGFAKRIERTHGALEYGDLLQAGLCGLARAAERFEPERGFAFATYALWWIRQSVTREVQNQTSTIRVPVHRIESRRKAGIFPWPRVRSIDAPLSATDPSSSTFGDTIRDERIPAPDVVLEAKERTEHLEAIMAAALLTARERRVLDARMRHDLPLQTIGDELNLTRERVRQIELEALNKLRKAARRLRVGSAA